ncbi:MAG: hypothetical protein MN733_25655, partial [Nitrososphaera sp.]|nr:hypothetical protein [Nitrososphaera sp.]
MNRLRPWFARNQARLFAVDIVCVTLLFFTFLMTSTFQLFPDELLTPLHVITVGLLSLIVLSIVWKGIVPLIICVLGVVLMHNAIILPLYASLDTGDATLGDRRVQWSLYSTRAVETATNMYFFLGAFT